jgi:hypothetical protein
MSLMGNTYTFERQFVALAAPKTLLQILAPAIRPLEIIEVFFNQESSATSAQYGAALLRKTAAATVTAAVVSTDILRHNLAQAASTVQVGTTSTGYNASAEGTNGEVIRRVGVNSLSGWCYLPLSDARVIVPAAGIIALTIFGTIPSATYNAGITFREIG